VETGVPPLFGQLFFLLKELLRIPLDVLSRTMTRVYVLSSDVKAPKDVLWSVVSARKIKLESSPVVEMDTESDPDRPGVYTGFCRYGERSLPFAYQVLEEKPGEAMVLRLLPEECDPVYRLGENYIGAVAVAGNGQNSTITNSCELTHTRFATRLIMPLTLLRSMQTLKRTAEARAGTGGQTSPEQIKTALLTGALTFASFFALFGWSTAAILLGVILIHEFGHVIAMRWTGIPVRGIYFVPFFGGVAIGDGLAKTEATRGLVALMGPAFSMLTTALFALLSLQNPEPFLADLALMSALLNGFNLLPILPLDGGQVLKSLMSRMPPGSTRVVQGIALAIGGMLAAAAGDYLLLVLFILVAPGVLAARPPAAMVPAPLSHRETMWLASGYLATLAFYLAVISGLWGDSPLPST
jgi:Zn-dependent protease